MKTISILLVAFFLSSCALPALPESQDMAVDIAAPVAAPDLGTAPDMTPDMGRDLGPVAVYHPRVRRHRAPHKAQQLASSYTHAQVLTWHDRELEALLQDPTVVK